MQTWAAKIQRRLRRVLVYPRAAKRRKTQGVVVVTLTVAPSGAVSGARIARGSGSADLDRAALDTIRKAGRLPRAPEGFIKPGYPFQVPLQFRLR